MKILPVNYVAINGSIYFRTAAEGSIALAAERGRMSFQVDHIRSELSQGWSVLVHGTASHVTEPEHLAELWGRAMAEPWGAGKRHRFICLTAETLTGRAVFLA